MVAGGRSRGRSGTPTRYCVVRLHTCASRPAALRRSRTRAAASALRPGNKVGLFFPPSGEAFRAGAHGSSNQPQSFPVWAGVVGLTAQPPVSAKRFIWGICFCPASGVPRAGGGGGKTERNRGTRGSNEKFQMKHKQLFFNPTSLRPHPAAPTFLFPSCLNFLPFLKIVFNCPPNPLS